jgi:hypothetical protein
MVVIAVATTMSSHDLRLSMLSPRPAAIDPPLGAVPAKRLPYL